jgi:hypothetical protein
MKTLNRPMFRYGGPIKEGVMNGIREPKKNGGSMANNQGPRRAALVGNPIYPNVDGRTNHVVPAVIGAGLAMPFIGAGIRAAARPFGQFVMRQVPKLIKTGKNKGQPLLDKKGVQQFYKSSTKNPATQGFDTNAVGGFFARDPVVSATGKVASGLLSPTTGGYIQKGARLVFSPTGIATGLIYSNGKYFNKDTGKEEPKPKGDIKLGDTVDIKGGGADTEPKVLTEAEQAKIESDNRMKQMDKYREIMDIKGMNKDAAYKSLIDASKIIQEGGNLKKSLKDGSLIQKVTAAASKRFDKVSDTENALRSLVAKGEIENVLNKEDKDLKRKQLRTSIAASEKVLAGDSFEKVVADYTIKNGQPQGSTLTGLARVKGIPIVETIDTKILDASIKNNEIVTDEVTFLENEVQKGIQDNDPLPPGNYVIKGSIIKVDEEGNVSRAL